MKSPSYAEVCAQNRHGANGIAPTISAIGRRWCLEHLAFAGDPVIVSVAEW